MSLNGTYNNKVLNAQLVITDANNANGTAKGTFSMGGVSYTVAVHYHFENNTGSLTVLQVWTSNTYGWDYIGAAGSTPTQDGSRGILLSGGTSTVSTTNGFSGLFTK